VSKKSAKIAALIESCRGHDLDAHYLGFFECFNQQLFYEAHDVLEELWLADRHGPNFSFHKGLIQLAGAFVHLQKNRLRPSAALFKLARTNLQKYPGQHDGLNIAGTLSLIEHWLGELESKDFAINPLKADNAPQLRLRMKDDHNGKEDIEANATLVIATRNAHKVAEIRAILSGRFQYLTLREFPDAPAVVEDAPTFAGNAAKKSVELSEWLATHHAGQMKPASAHFVLADDSGLEVDALQGAPGVYSARFAALDTGGAGNAPDVDNNAKLLRLLQNVPAAQRTARFRCVLALTPVSEPILKNASPVCAANEAELQTQLFDGACEGRIAIAPSGKGGFGYDPLFIPDGHIQSFAELGEATKNQLSHRAKALAKLRIYLDSISVR
jgi:XTP/dITP diphosphohydrolase